MYYTEMYLTGTLQLYNVLCSSVPKLVQFCAVNANIKMLFLS